MREADFQRRLIQDIKTILPGSMVLKNDPNYIQGVPDLLVLHGDRWAALEVKRNATAPYRPNQEYYLGVMNEMSYAATVYPENVEEVLHDLQRSFEIGR